MKHRYPIVAVVATIAIAAGGFALYSVGMDRGMKMAAPAAPVEPGKKVLYWHDPMVPGQKFDKPGKSPFMDMQLVPVYGDGAADEGSVAISSRVQQNLGIRTVEAVKGDLARSVETVGSVAYNERDVAVVQARASGFVEKVHVRATFDSVRRGQALVDLYVPDWIAAQEEYLGVQRMTGVGLDGLREGALQRMKLAGMTDEVVRRVESSQRVQPRVTLTAPIAGVIAELGAREGMTVAPGATLFRINGLGTVWVNAEVPEGLAGQVRPGAQVEARAAALPGELFKGKVSAILPEVNAATRTLKARVELANPGARLVPGMFATLSFAPAARREAVLVPSEAVIQTGKRTVVVVADAATDGKQQLAPVDVEIGAESDGMTEITKGIAAGTKVVVSGQFLIDSEASLKSSGMRMSEGAGASAATHGGDGKVEAVGKDSVTLSHGPIPSMQWGAMTMEFKLPPGVAARPPAPGAMVHFEFTASPKGEFEITSIQPKGAAK
ncbi:MAG: efflux RND transporter periplasmic adaptor subunit [Usitatibacter sp.]